MILLAAGCAAVERAPPGSETSAAVAAPVPGPAAAPPEVVEAPPSRAPSKAGNGAKAAPPAARPAAKAPAAAALPAQAPAPAPARASGAPPSPAKPPLDLNSLEARLRATDAIGVFTKIALKNQVDDLLDQFREYYAGKLKTSLAELRPPYDRLLLKVLALLQDEDPDLARAIVDSREPIWSILADPARFGTL
jgi:hypothetical protein